RTAHRAPRSADYRTSEIDRADVRLIQRRLRSTSIQPFVAILDTVTVSLVPSTHVISYRLPVRRKPGEGTSVTRTLGVLLMATRQSPCCCTAGLFATVTAGVFVTLTDPVTFMMPLPGPGRGLISCCADTATHSNPAPASATTTVNFCTNP